MDFKEYDLICSLGGNCAAAHNILYKGLRHYSLPFDWCYIKNDLPIEYLNSGFQNNFQDFLLKENLVELTGAEYNNSHTDKAQYKDTLTGYYFVNHFKKDNDFDSEYQTVYSKLRRRLNRLQNKIVQGKNFLFILTCSFEIDLNKIKKLQTTLTDLYPDKVFDFKVMFFNQSEDKDIIDKNLHCKYIRRTENNNDYYTTNKEWQFLDKVKLTGNNPLVSVLVPAYNHEKYVQGTIKSIIEQTYQNIELLIIDDGSKDATWQKMQELKQECEQRFSRVYFETKENEGTCHTFNKLVAQARGEFVYIIASDDLAKPNAIQDLVEFLSKNKSYVLCVGDNELINSDGKICFWDSERVMTDTKENAKYLTFGAFLKEHRGELDFQSKRFGGYDTFLRGNYIPNGYLIRKSAMDKIEKFTPEAPLEDYFLHLQLSKIGKYKYLDKVLFSYRWHDSNTMKNTEKIAMYGRKTKEFEEKLVNSNKTKWKIKRIYKKYHQKGYLWRIDRKRFNIRVKTYLTPNNTFKRYACFCGLEIRYRKN